MAFEPVYTMADWYDGPRRGVASVNGKPHLYESCWNDIDSDDDDVFLLSEISQETLSLAIEQWEIWLRWCAAFKRGATTIATHPSLPDDRQRYDELQLHLENALVLNEKIAFAATAEFRFTPSDSDSNSLAQVQWTIITLEPRMDRRVHYRWNEQVDPNHPSNPSGGSDVS